MIADGPVSFLDTNILVYAFEKASSPKKRTGPRSRLRCARVPQKRVAESLVNELIDQDRLRLSTQVLQELFVTLTRKATHPCPVDEALAVLDDLAAWPVMVIDVSAIRAAARLAGQARLSFWDSLIVVAAARAGASILYTEDLNDGQEILGVRVKNPFQSLAV